MVKAKVSYHTHSWWAEVWQGNTRLVETRRFTWWGAKRTARRHANQIKATHPNFYPDRNETS